ncbi:MAG TPA: NAD-dependent malic enzyme, partial [Acidimicrobiales bacterium]|nr:NAD-dependent malic enzyme [Acidimicrobiales bacterium]
HGTAVVVLAALTNALKVVGKRMQDVKVVMAGVGAAGVAITKILMEAGVHDVIGVDRKGAIWEGRPDLDVSKRWFAEHTNREQRKGTLSEVLPGADVFIGVSGPGLLHRDDLREMNTDPIVFALANPDPEITPEEAEGLVAVMATGRSDYPNQINNVLCFPGIFRGALDAAATSITEGMKLAAAEAIARSVPEDELSAGYIVPSVFNKRVVERVAAAVAEAAVAGGVVRGK